MLIGSHYFLLATAALLLRAVAQPADCSRTSTGFPPLNDPFFVAYQGARGGLYPEGANRRPAAHEAEGLRLAAEVRPRDAAGGIDDPDGKIVLISIGMSNTTQEFSVFKRLADRDSEKSPRLVIVDGAQGGWAAERIVADGAAYWATLEARLAAAGVTSAQVQAAWMKEANARPTLPFPEDARRLASDLRSLAQILRSRFPNLRLLYLSSRIYAGYASTSLNPEPFAYQSGFAVKWLIEEQIRGDPELSFASGRAPWLSWGPYLWADGTAMRHDGLVWNCSDLQQDGTHPSESGREKVARMLLDFLKSDTTARPWFVRPPAVAPPKPAPAAAVNAAAYSPEVAAGSIASLFGFELAATEEAARELPLPTVLGGTMVKVGDEVAVLYYVSARQVNFLMPRAPAAAEVTVVRGTARSEAVPLTLTAYAPGIFTLDGRPDGPAAALHADHRPVSSGRPAGRGETIQLFLTGMGVLNPLSRRPEILPVVRVGGLPADITFSGPAPGYPGLDQINFRVPSGAPVGPAVPLRVELGPWASNGATLAVGPDE